MTLPNFLIVGAAKSGTTTLQDHLMDHPQVFMPSKEVQFFSKDTTYAKGLDWYATHFDGVQGQPAIGEKSPAYCYVPEAAERIRESIPDVRLLWIFRDPVSRAYSNYWHLVLRGLEYLPFEEALKREAERINEDLAFGYQKRSMYAEQVRRFLDFFPREKMLFCLFEDMKEDPAGSIQKAYEFLSIDTDVVTRPQPKSSNVARLPRNIWLQHCTRKLFGRGKVFGLVYRLNRSKAVGYPKISNETREALREKFRAHNEELAELTGLDLTKWYAPKPPAPVNTA